MTHNYSKYFENFFAIKCEECFICYSNGKTSNEEIQEIFMKRQGLNYPLISLGYAFNCNCFNTFAHNKCLIDIKKCPTCRKIVEKPNLYVHTIFDYLFGFIFSIVKSNLYLLDQIKNICGIIIIFMVLTHILIENNYIQITSDWKFKLSIGLLICIQFICGSIFIMEDYFAKYWLYDRKNKKINSI